MHINLPPPRKNQHIPPGEKENHLQQCFEMGYDSSQEDTLPETNIAPENGWLEGEISYREGLFSGASC